MCAKNHSSSCILDHSALNKAPMKPMKGIPLVVKTAITEKASMLGWFTLVIQDWEKTS